MTLLSYNLYQSLRRLTFYLLPDSSVHRASYPLPLSLPQAEQQG